MTKPKPSRSRSRIVYKGLARRIDGKRTREAGGSNLARKFCGEYVGITIPSPCSLKNVVEHIAEILQIPIDHLALELEKNVAPRSVSIAGVLFGELDNIAENYPNVYWWFSKQGLCMEVVAPPTAPPGFDDIAGSLIIAARTRLGTNRLPKEEYKKLAAQLSKFPLRDYLSSKWQNELTEWNRKHPPAINSFEAAIGKKQPPWIHRQAMRRLYRAANNCEKRTLETVHF